MVWPAMSGEAQVGHGTGTGSTKQGWPELRRAEHSAWCEVGWVLWSGYDTGSGLGQLRKRVLGLAFWARSVGFGDPG
jgi:hypothetical protein